LERELSDTKEIQEKVDKDRGNRLKENFEAFVNEFRNESDRAAVILGASKLDQLLGMLLERFLLPCANSTDNLFANNGPLGSFSSRIDMCFRLGLIDSEFSKSIHLTRRIRNSFAHEVYGAKLDEGAHKDRVRSLAAPFKDHEHYRFLRTSYFTNVDEQRAVFSSVLGLMIVGLDVAVYGVQPVSNENAYGVLGK
jgi:DNA-binding MltR family transcriptional regulator